MRTFAVAAVAACWAAWAGAFAVRASWRGNARPVATRTAPSLAGLALEVVAYTLACAHMGHAGTARLLLAVVAALPAPVLSWTALRHLGKQWRVKAGLYQNHELVRTGPYAVIRHPIYASMLSLLAGTMLLGTRWPWWLIALAVFLTGTELRVRTEDRLLEGAFGPAFRQYRARVPAYLPFVR